MLCAEVEQDRLQVLGQKVAVVLVVGHRELVAHLGQREHLEVFTIRP